MASAAPKSNSSRSGSGLASRPVHRHGTKCPTGLEAVRRSQWARDQPPLFNRQCTSRPSHKVRLPHLASFAPEGSSQCFARVSNLWLGPGGGEEWMRSNMPPGRTDYVRRRHAAEAARLAAKWSIMASCKFKRREAGRLVADRSSCPCLKRVSVLLPRFSCASRIQTILSVLSLLFAALAVSVMPPWPSPALPPRISVVWP